MVKIPPTGPAGGSRLAMIGLITVNSALVVIGLAIEVTVTMTGPVPFGTALGTVATICELLQLVIVVASAPLNVMVLVPCMVPKFDPVTVTEVPMVPTMGVTPVTNGVVPSVTATLSKVAGSSVPKPLTASPI